jgi:uncharacterized secreted protein with C-terminal beta-propeller domain
MDKTNRQQETSAWLNGFLRRFNGQTQKSAKRRNAGSVRPVIPAALEQLENRQLLSAATGPFQEPPQLAPSDFDPTTGETINFEAAADGETTLLTILDASNADPAISIVSLSISRLRSFIEISDDGRSVEYTPFVGAAGEDSFVYQRSDGSTHEVTIELVAPAENDSFTVFEASPATTLDVLANDTLPQGYTGPGKITSVSFGSRGGDIQISEDGKSVIYQPRVGVHGSESFAYVVDESFSALANVTIERILKDDSYSDPRFPIFGSAPLSFTFNSYDEPIVVSPLNNDRFDETAYEGARQITSVQLRSSLEPGTVTIGDDGQSVVFQPTRGFKGTARIDYVVDGVLTARISIRVPELAKRDSLLLDTNSSSHAIDVLANDRLPSGAFIESVTDDESIAISENGRSLIFTPPQGFTGFRRFTYTVSNGAMGHLDVRVSSPVRNDFYTQPQDTTDNRLNVLSNDFAGDGFTGVRSITAVSEPEHGTVRIAADGQSLFYTPDSGFVGSDSVTYVVNDQLSAQVSINVTTRARSDYYRIGYFSGDAFVLPVLNNDRLAPLGHRITSVTELDPALGQIAISEDGFSLVFTASGNGSQYATFSYTVADKYTGEVRLSTFSLAHADSDVAKVAQNESILVNVLANDDFDDTEESFRYESSTIFSSGEYQGARIITAVDEPESGGQVTISADGKSVTYTPAQDYFGRDSFTYTVDDQLTATVFVEVLRYVRDDSLAVSAGSTGNVLKVLLNDPMSDYSGAGLISAVSVTTAGGSVEIAADGKTVLYTPAAGFSGLDSFTYTLDDKQVATVEVQVVESAQDFFVGFASYEEFREWLIQDALDRYDSEFGKSRNFFPFAYDRGFALSSTTSLQTISADSSPSFSTTNVQVAGVDEADLVENDGEHLYFISGTDLIVIKAHPADELAEVGRYSIDGTPIGMYLHEGRLTIISQKFGLATNSNRADGGVVLLDLIYQPRTQADPKTIVTVLDISNPADPEFIKQTSINGTYVESRSVEGSVSVVVNSGAMVLPRPIVSTQTDDSLTITNNSRIRTGDLGNNQFFFPGYGSGILESSEEYEARVRANFDTLLADLLPQYETQDAAGIATTDLLSNPLDWHRVLTNPDNQLLSVVEFNAANDSETAPDVESILTSKADEVYATRDHFYVFGNSYENGHQQTLIQQFSWADGGTTELVGIGRVEGRLLDQFAIDVSDDQLRLVLSVYRTTETGRRAASDLVILENSNGLFQATGSLLDIARGQTAKAVRFEGDLAFVSTFRTASPLNVIDLSHPECPEFIGQIRTAGQVDYMQMIDSTHLVVLGSNATNYNSGPLTLSIYDVSDPSNPDLLDRDVLAAYSSSIAQDDHHAFQWYAEHKTLAIPYSANIPRPFYYRGLFADQDVGPNYELKTFKIDVSLGDDEATITSNGSLSQPGEVLRSAFIGDNLYSLGNQQVQVTNINAPGDDLQTLDLEFNPVAITPPPFFRYHLLADDSPLWFTTSAAPVERPALSELVTDVTDGILNVNATNFVSPRIEGVFDAANNQIVIDIYRDNDDGTPATTPFFTQSFDADEISEVHVQLGDTDDTVNLSQLRVPTHIEGGAGNDILIGGRKRDLIEGGPGNDILLGASGKDELRGGSGDDFLKGQGGGDMLDGGLGIDKLYGGAGRNDFRDDVAGIVVATNNGYESERGDFADSRRPMRSIELRGSASNDTLDFSRLFGVNVSLLGGQGNDIIIGSQGDDYIVGGAGDDILLGAAGSDFMLGGKGRDQMRGHSGRDTMQGGQGSDRIDGGRGRNELVREQFQPHSQDVFDPEVDTLIGEFDEITIPEIDVQTLNDTLLDVLDSAGI